MEGIAQGTTLAGRYELQRTLSHSDTSQTWLANDTTLDREVVATVFAREGDTSAAALDSARRAAGVEDRHLPRVLDVGNQDEFSYVITESLHGAESLASLLQFDPLPPEEARRIVGEAASGLHTAAGRGLHHGVLTLHEVVRAQDGSVFVVGVATLGALAGVDDADSAQASRDDTVALTSILYAALTGQWPGEQQVPGISSVQRDSQGHVPAPRAEHSAIPGDLDAVCTQVLNDDDGPKTPGALAKQLAPWSQEIVDEHSTGESTSAGVEGPAAAAAVPPGVRSFADTDRGEDITMVGRRPQFDRDVTSTFDATRDADDYDPSFSDLEPPLPLLQSGTDDPDNHSSKLALAIVAAFLIGALVLGILGVQGLLGGGGGSSAAGSSSSSTSSQSTSATPTKSYGPSGQQVKVASASTFDPQGNDREHPELAGNVIDGNTSTAWRTRIFSSPTLGSRPGTGLILDLGKSSQVGSIKIGIQGGPTTIQVFVTNSKSMSGASPFGTVNNGSGQQTVTGTTPATGRYVIVWVTKLSANDGGYREKITEIEVLT